MRPLRNIAAERRQQHRINAGVAQLVEQRIRNAKVGGSIPLSGTNKFNGLPQGEPFLFLLRVTPGTTVSTSPARGGLQRTRPSSCRSAPVSQAAPSQRGARSNAA